MALLHFALNNSLCAPWRVADGALRKPQALLRKQSTSGAALAGAVDHALPNDHWEANRPPARPPPQGGTAGSTRPGGITARVDKVRRGRWQLLVVGFCVEGFCVERERMEGFYVEWKRSRAAERVGVSAQFPSAQLRCRVLGSS